MPSHASRDTPAPESVAEALIAFLGTRSWRECKAVAKARKRELTSEAAQHLIHALMVIHSDDTQAQDYLRVALDFLRWCRRIGVTVVFLLRAHPRDVAESSRRLDQWLDRPHPPTELASLGALAVSIGQSWASLRGDIPFVSARTATPERFEETKIELIQSLDERRTVVFCGAGISYPSGLPLANEIIRHMLARLEVSAPEAKILLGSALPFEAFMEKLQLGSHPERLFSIFEMGTPSTTHRFLAKLARRKQLKVICTTNFDRLIEGALQDEGLVAGRDFAVFCRDAEIKGIDWSDDRVLLIKLHGSVDAMDEMAITLRQVASRVLLEPRRNALKHVFSSGPHSHVLVLGYSCSDFFDITPAVEALGTQEKKVLFVDHSADLDDRSSGQVEEIDRKSHKNPFRGFENGKRIYLDLPRFTGRFQA